MVDETLGEVPADAEIPVEEPSQETVAEPAPPKVDEPEDKIQKRFDKLTKEKYEAKREADRLRWQLEQLQTRAKPEPVAPTPPTLESSGFDEDKYRQAEREYLKQTLLAEIRNEQQAEREKATAQSRQSEFDKRQAEFIKSTPDYAEKVMGNDSLPITATMADAIRESDVGPQVAYYLAENEELAAKIAGLSPIAQAREIGRIEARFEQKPAAPKVSQAPSPPPKLEGADPAVRPKTTDPESDKLSDEEWVAMERKRLAKRK